MTSSQGMNLVATSIYLSIVGLASLAASVWVLARDLQGDAPGWITWLSVLGAVVALALSMGVVRRWEGQMTRRLA